MATPTNSLLGLTGDDVVDGMTNGTYWRESGEVTLNWSISDGFNGYYWNDPSAAADMIESALNTVSQYANLSFDFVGSFTGYGDNPIDAANAGSEMNFSWSGTGDLFSSDNQLARGYFPYDYNDPPYEGLAGDIYVNSDSVANSANVGGWPYDAGSAGRSLLFHEIGHALGLKHPHDGGATNSPTFGELGLNAFDTERYTTMSYNDACNNEGQYNAAEPMPFDVIGLQYLYGLDTSHNAGNTTHNLRVTNQYETIWDAGGSDTVSAAGSGDGWQIALPDTQISSEVTELWGVAEPLSSASKSTPTTLYWLEGDIENAVGSAHGDEIEGNQLSNRVDGRAGADTLYGGDGDDLLVGGWAGFEGDTLNGGAGTDTASYAGSPGAVSVDLGAGTGRGWSAEGDVLNSVENVTGSAYGDRLIGDSGDNVLSGGESNAATGDDVLVGRAGADTLYGGDGDDRLVGGWAGFEGDTLNGGAGTDTASYAGSPGAVSVDLGAGTGRGWSAEGDVLNSIENVTGSRYDDVLTGDDGANVLSGQYGADTLGGGDGDDLLVGGWAGFEGDTLNGGAGTDTASYAGSPGAVSVDLGAGTGRGWSAEGDVLNSVENVEGSQHGDRLIGDSGANVIQGHGGNDSLAGGAGRDKFVFSPDMGRDTIFGWQDGTDVLDFQAFGFADFQAVSERAQMDGGGHLWIDVGSDADVRVLGFSKTEFDSGDVLV